MNSLKLGKTPYISKVSKIREIIFASEGVFPIGSYVEWRNSLYRAGYAESLVQKDNRRLLILGELEAAGRYFWECAFGTSTQERITVEKAMAQVSLSHRAPMKLLQKPLPPSLYGPPSGERPTKAQKLN